MGMYVSQLRSVPVGAYQYYVYVIDPSSRASHSEEIGGFFQRFAAQSGIDAVIVRGPNDLSRQLYEFLSKNAQRDYGAIEHLFHEITCLLISKGALQTTTDELYVIPLMEGSAEGPSHREFLDRLLASLLESMRDGKVSEFCRSLGAKEVSLSGIKSGMLIATLRRINESLELKPNFAGIGLNINGIIERALGPAERSVP